MLSTWTKKENSTGTLNVTINEDAWKDAQKRAFKKLAKDVEVPGFRKGKAPEAMIKKAVSEQSILMEAVNEALQEMYSFALEQENVVPIAQPEVAIQSLTASELVVDFNITVSPEVTLASDYKTLSFKPKQVILVEEHTAPTAAGVVTVKLPCAVHPLASVTVTV